MPPVIECGPFTTEPSEATNNRMDDPLPGLLTANQRETLPLVGSIRLSADRTGGALEVFEFEWPGSAVPPPHTHRERDELFHVTQGSLEFVLGHDTVTATEGSLVYVPRGTRHGFTPGPGSKALVITMPAGLEGFFRELSAGLAAGKTAAEVRASLAGRFDSFPDAD